MYNIILIYINVFKNTFPNSKPNFPALKATIFRSGHNPQKGKEPRKGKMEWKKEEKPREGRQRHKESRREREKNVQDIDSPAAGNGFEYLCYNLSLPIRKSFLWS